jgi:hypothetical protein
MVRSWKMIDEVIYGPTPSMAMEILLKLPPEKILSRPRS